MLSAKLPKLFQRRPSQLPNPLARHDIRLDQSLLAPTKAVARIHFQPLSAKHLQAYLNEFAFRFNRRFYPYNAFRSLLGIAGEVDAPTFAALYSGEWRHPICSGCVS